MGRKVVIVGGVVGGASIASRLRRMSEEAEITIFERGEYISFANCGLPYHIGEVIEDRSSLLVQTPEAMESRFDIEVNIQHEVVEIDRDNKRVKVKDIVSGEKFWEDYDKLVLSPGAEPIMPPLQGLDGDNVFTLRNIPDTDAIKGYVDNNDPETAVVVDREMAAMVHNQLRTQGTSIAKIFDLSAGATGSNEKQLKETEIDYEVSYTTSKNHAGYYPGAVPMTVKIIFTPEEGRLLGAQITGYDGVDKRIDVFATAIRNGNTIC